jgi:hypothetical protein
MGDQAVPSLPDQNPGEIPPGGLMGAPAGVPCPPWDYSRGGLSGGCLALPGIAPGVGLAGVPCPP